MNNMKENILSLDELKLFVNADWSYGRSLLHLE